MSLHFVYLPKSSHIDREKIKRLFQKTVLEQLTGKPINCHKENLSGYGGAHVQSSTNSKSKRRISNHRQDEESDGKEEEKEAET